MWVFKKIKKIKIQSTQTEFFLIQIIIITRSRRRRKIWSAFQQSPKRVHYPDNKSYKAFNRYIMMIIIVHKNNVTDEEEEESTRKIVKSAGQVSNGWDYNMFW